MAKIFNFQEDTLDSDLFEGIVDRYKLRGSIVNGVTLETTPGGEFSITINGQFTEGHRKQFTIGYLLGRH